MPVGPNQPGRTRDKTKRSPDPFRSSPALRGRWGSRARAACSGSCRSFRGRCRGRQKWRWAKNWLDECLLAPTFCGNPTYKWVLATRVNSLFGNMDGLPAVRILSENQGPPGWPSLQMVQGNTHCRETNGTVQLRVECCPRRPANQAQAGNARLGARFTMTWAAANPLADSSFVTSQAICLTMGALCGSGAGYIRSRQKLQDCIMRKWGSSCDTVDGRNPEPPKKPGMRIPQYIQKHMLR